MISSFAQFSQAHYAEEEPAEVLGSHPEQELGFGQGANQLRDNLGIQQEAFMRVDRPARPRCRLSAIPSPMLTHRSVLPGAANRPFSKRMSHS